MQRLADIEIKYLKGVGEAKAKTLKKEFEISTFRDLAYFFPTRYVDRSKFYKIAELMPDMPTVQIKGSFVQFTTEGEGMRKRLIGTFTDGRHLMEVVWFQKVHIFASSYHIGEEYVLFGKPTYWRDHYQMTHPEVEKYNPERPPEGLRGVYRVGEGAKKSFISSRSIHTLVMNLFQNEKFQQIREVLPEHLVKKYGMMPLKEAIIAMHNPENPRELARARERMKFEELYYLELHILQFTRNRSQKFQGYQFAHIGHYFNTFYKECIPFELTGAQKRVLREIRQDMRAGAQMNRLLQGDVGSGKTMVAFMSMLMAVDNDCQACLMAPTEILATQHYNTLKDWCDKLGLKIRLLTGSSRTKERREIHAGLEDGSLQLLVGTHALLEEKVKFKKLGLAIIDEQHRFGVAQRAKLWMKGTLLPHVLIMTATPIPRTLSLTVYGDLEVSVIDELPPGRKPVNTSLHYVEQHLEVDRLVYSQLKAGRQVYYVYPLIQENDKMELKSLEEGYRQVCETFPEYRVCFVHGKMTPDEKDHQMQLFVEGTARIMVATTVIEVGVNVPNASVMVIENAERFGLSQLHQLRGRVGRGADQSYCILMAKQQMGADTRKRLKIMTETNDGFLVSEADLKLRGPGDFEGTQQSGFPIDLKVTDLARDGQMIQLAREEAIKTLDEFTPLPAPVPAELLQRFPTTIDWSKIS